MQQDVQRHQQRAERIDALLQEVSEFADTQARATAEELVQLLLDLYGEGLARVLEITHHTQMTGDKLIERFTQDELLASLFLLHGLHPLDLETRVRQALAKVSSGRGTIDLLRLEESKAYLRLDGNCHSCPTSSASLQAQIEQALREAAPELEEIHIEQDQRTSKPVTFVPTRRRQQKQGRQL